MSSFYNRTSEPQNGDIAKHEIYGTVRLMGELTLASGTWYEFWVVECTENEELKIVRLDQLTDIGYYGD